MSQYDPKNELVLGRSLKVQTLAIPFVVVGNATPANVSLTNDEPSILFLRSAGVDQITTASGALATGETATYTTAPADATGVLNALVKIQEPVVKVISAMIVGRANGLVEPAFLGSATGITVGAAGGSSIMLAIDSATALNAANTLNATLHVTYQV
jgi:hypothetical protein